MRKPIPASALTAFILVLYAVVFSIAGNPPMLVSVDVSSRDSYLKLQKLRLDVINIADGAAQAIIDSTEQAVLIDNGLTFKVIHSNLTAYYNSRNPLSTSMGGYLTFPEIVAVIDSLHNRFPALCTAKDSIGYSTQGRALWAFKISDNPDLDEDEPEILFNALSHAREPMPMQWLMAFAGYLCEHYGSDSLVTHLVNNREIVFVPVVNPDGYEYNRQINPSGGGLWRKNRRVSPGAVDLNRNWGYKWGYDNVGSSPYPADETYRGPAAFSEPETQFLRLFINSRHFDYVMSLHAFGNYYLYPYGYALVDYPQLEIQRAVGDSLTSIAPFTYGRPYELLYFTNGDCNDWVWGDSLEKPRIYCGTIEIGNDADGFWPAAARIPYYTQLMMPVGLFLCQLAGHVAGILPPRPPSIAPFTDTITTEGFTVSWTHLDTANPAIVYELVEKRSINIFTDEFEHLTGYWLTTGFVATTDNFYSPNYSLYSGLGDYYQAAATSIESYEVQEADTVKFYTLYSIENNFDYAYFEISTDGGQTFSNVPGNITTPDNPNGNNLGNGITGISGEWILAAFPVGDYAGEQVLFKFEYITDWSGTGNGIYVDDFWPTVNFDRVDVLDDSIVIPQYQLTGRGDGIYFYEVRARDAEGQWSLFSKRVAAILNVAACPYILGDINGDSSTIGADVIYGVRYFKGFGPPPPDSCFLDSAGTYLYVAADANGNCEFRGSDITRLVAYFKGYVSLSYCHFFPPPAR